jgi:general secretion pathway protein F
MPTFRYQGYTASGQPRKGRVEALSAKEARERLIARGVFPGEVAPVGRGGKFDAGKRSVLYRELGALLQAGLPLDRALGLLSENPELAAGAETLASVGDHIKEGVDFSEVLGRQLQGAREDEVAVLGAGEAAGRLPQVCMELADHLEEEAGVADQIRTALVYPAVISLVALVVLTVLVGFLLPAYDQLLSGVGQEMPWLTRGALALGRGVRHPLGWGALLLMLLLLARGAAGLRKRPGGIFSMRWYRVPVLGPALASLARARFSRTLALLLEGGIPLHRALETAGRAAGAPGLASACAAAAKRVSHGERLADVLMEIPVLKEDLPGWARAGEASGDLSGLFRHAARGHQRAWDRNLRRLLALLEPLLIVAVGLLILLVALAVLLPMLRLNRGLTQ